MKVNLNPWKSIVAMLVLALACITDVAMAQTVIFSNPITGSNITASPYTTGQTVVSNATSTGIARGSGISSSGANDRYNASGWTNNNNLKTSDYFSLPITPADGYHINFSSFVYTSQRSGSGPNSFAFRSSETSFGTNIGSPNSTGTTISLTNASYQNITAATEFRFYAYNSSGGTFSIDGFTFNGSILGTSATSLSGFSTCSGTASTAQSFTVNGSGLSPANATITVAPSANYEVSITSATSGFLGSGSATFTASSGSVSRTVWVRLKSSAAAGTFNETINVSGGGFATGDGIDVAVAGTVNGNSTLSLTSLAATTNQTVCINTAITAITYSVGGGGTGASVTGLPTGVNGVYNSGTKVFTISGTPTVSGTFNYTVTTTGPCTNTSLNGTITVNVASTISLTSAVGTNTQTRCINNAITDITYGIGGTATGASITAGALPTGVTGVFNAGVFTISGTPTVAGTFNYTVSSTGPCPASLTGTITVNNNSTLALSSAVGTDNQTRCINTAITNITYLVGAGGTGATVSGLPTGVTGNYNGGTKVYTISGAPSVAGTFTYTVTATGPCVNPFLTGTIVVNGAATANAGTAVTTCANSGAVNITAGATSTNNAGVTWTSNGSGTFTNANSLTLAEYTPSVADIAAGSVTLTLTATGNAPCVNATSNKTLTIRPVPATTGVTICEGTASAALTVQSSCTENTAVSTSATLPGSGTNQTGIGNTAWTNPGNILTNNNVNATATLSNASAVSNYLRASGFNFSSIPVNANIKGVTVTISRFASNVAGATRIRDNEVRLVKAGTIVGNNKSNAGVDWPTAEGSFNYGSTTDLWGTTLTASDVTNANFGVALSVLNATGVGNSYTANVDLIQMTITYAVPGTLNWYTVSSGGTLIGSGNSFDPVGVANSGLANTNTAGTTTYYAECSTVTGCRTPTTFTILPAPVAPVSGGDQTVCENGNPAQTLTATATGSNITWYDAASNGSTVATPALTGAGSVTYYAQSSDGTCSSLTRTPVTLTINAAPAAPTASNQTVCSDGNPAQTLTATASGGTITWYDAASAGSVVASPTQTGVGSSTYYAESFNGTCISLTRTPVTLTINDVPAIPVSGGDQTVCSDGTPTQTLTATATGSNLTWYDAASGGNLVSVPELVGVGTVTYYAESSNGLCASLSRTAVTLTINAVPAAPVASHQTVCTDGSNTQTLTATASGGTITWYDAASNGNMVASPVQVGVGSVTYYAEASNGLCNSLTRTPVTLTINPAPAAPLSGGDQVVCQTSNPAQTLTATASGGTISWYDAASNGSLVGSPVQVGPGSVTYYAQSFDGTCSSLTRTPVSLTILAAPAAPTASNQSVCYSGNPTQTLTATASGGTITWYDAASGGNVVSTPELVGVGAVTYYAESFNGSCSSLTRTAVTLKINLPPATPAAIIGNKNVCPFVGNGSTVTYSIAPVPFAETYRWTLPPFVNLVSASTDSTSITVSFDNNFGSSPNRQIRVRSISACGNSNQAIIYLTAQFASTPAPISGPTDVCSYLNNSVVATYTIAKVTAATEYIWTVPAGVSVVHPNGLGENDTTINVTFDLAFNTSSITVRSLNDCGTSSARSITITRNLPPTPGLINGPSNACAFIGPGGNQAQYSIRKVNGAIAYTWSAPPQAEIEHLNPAGPNDTAILVRFHHSFNNGAVTVTATSGCGTSTTPRSMAVGKLNPATPGVIDVIQLTTCPNRTYSYTVASMPSNATTLNWTIPASGSIVSGQGTTSIVVSYPGTAVSGNVTVQALNSCGNSVVRQAPVKLPACPPEFAGSGNGGLFKGTTVSPASVENMQVALFPNPTTSNFNVNVQSVSKDQVTIRVLDIQGREMSRKLMQPNAIQTLGNQLKAGTYFIEVLQGNQRSVQKLIKL